MVKNHHGEVHGHSHHKHSDGAGHGHGHGSGGQRIDDHSNWIGKGSSESVFPKGVHVKNEVGAEGSGSVMHYEDTTEAIHKAQDMAKGKAKSHGRKDYMRN